MGGKKKALFWISYSDLMTSLFFTFLVLFVVVIISTGMVHNNSQKEKQVLRDSLAHVNATNEQLKQILNLEEQFNILASNSSFKYDKQKSVFYAKDFIGIEIFEPNKDIIKPEYLGKVDEVGEDIKELMRKLDKTNKNFKYLMIIEGTAAIPYEAKQSKTYNPDQIDMYELSYRRALALYLRWKDLNFREGNTEVIIAGSGFNGINRDDKIEENNKRFVIQIIPKVENPKQ
nr:hypothetical protein [uncultured Porphyromonas sp.]